jgi:hypothetical protein
MSKLCSCSLDEIGPRGRTAAGLLAQESSGHLASERSSFISLRAPIV